ncbi:MAG: nuclear transport factor 2 family protein [Devosia sp.]
MHSTRFLAAAALTAVFAAADLGSAMAQAFTPDQKVQQYDLTEQNKQLVTTAYQALFGDHDLTALDRYWADTYIQHNPYMSDGREAVKQALKQWGILDAPKQKISFLRVIAESDLVMTQIAQPGQKNGPPTVIVDIFRVADGKIAEHWDVTQQVPNDATNQRSMY